MGIRNKTLIDSIRRNDPYFEDMITRSVYHSNAIEGNTLSFYETYQVIFNCGSDEELRAVKPRDLYEAINLKFAMDYIFRHLDEEVTIPYIIKLGQFVNKNIDEISSFRTGRVLLCKYSLENGYPPFVVPKEERNQYMNLLADCNIEGMKNFFEKLIYAEKERMKQFQIDITKFE